MPARLRKLLGVLALFAYMALYIALVAVIADHYVMSAPWWAQIPFFLIAGIIWVTPLKPLFTWMNARG
ncbi:MAG: DUF2842 domain-containing protein [Hyphomonadaceae bacterium]